MIIKNTCGLFLTVVNSEVYLIHQTAKKFLVAKSDNHVPTILQTPSPHGWKHSFGLAQSNLELAKICIWFLHFQEFEVNDLRSYYASIIVGKSNVDSEPYDNHQPDSERSSAVYHTLQIDSGLDSEYAKEKLFKKTINTLSNMHSFYKYAASNWPSHLSNASSLPDASLLDFVAHEMCDLSSQAFRSWCCSVDREIPIIYSYHYRHVTDATNLLGGVCLGLVQVVELLLEEDFDPNFQDYCGCTPLYWASRSGDEGIARFLLAKKANINPSRCRQVGPRTPLVTALEHRGEAVVRLLLNQNVDVNARDSGGRSPLWWAAHSGWAAGVKILLDHGADPNIEADFRKPPIFALRIGGVDEVARLIEQYQLKREQICEATETPSIPNVVPTLGDAGDSPTPAHTDIDPT